MKRRGSSLLGQGDYGGGQAQDTGRPTGTLPVGRFAAEGTTEAGTGARPPARSGEEEPTLPVAPSEVGVLYAGPERRHYQADWAQWSVADRRTRPYEYPQRQEV
jgi:hypothetical protein